MALTKVTYSMINGAPAVNVVDFGASPTATATENTAAIQAAINSADIVFIPEGTYQINDALTIGDKNCTILGADPQSTILTQTNAAKDVIYFNRTGNNYETTVKNLKCSGGLSGIRIDGGFISKTSILENLECVSQAHSGLRIEGDSTFINGKVRNLLIENNTPTLYGIYINGYNTINATEFQNISVIGGQIGVYLHETTSINVSTVWTNLTIESIETVGLSVTGMEATFISSYFEQCGESFDTADVNLYSNATATPCRVTFINPYFGPRGTGQLTNHVISFRENAITLTLYGRSDQAAYAIDGNSKTAASNIFLYGNASTYEVVSFSNREYRYGYFQGTYTGTLTGVTTLVQPTVRYEKNGHTVTLVVAANASGTSNATTKTITGMPASLFPTTNVRGVCLTSDNGGAYTASDFYVDTSGVINISTNGISAWTASGTATILAFTISYVL